MTTNPMRPRRATTTRTQQPAADAATAFRSAADDRVKITIRLDAQTRQDLHIQARRDGISVNELLCGLIAGYLSGDCHPRR